MMFLVNARGVWLRYCGAAILLSGHYVCITVVTTLVIGKPKENLGVWRDLDDLA
jgi:hypothetical protein